MGATMKRTASSIALLVLVILTVPGVLGTEKPEDVVSGAEATAHAAKDTAEAEAEAARDTAARTARDAQSQAEGTSTEAQREAGRLLLEAYDLAISIGNLGTSLALGIVSEVEGTLCPYTCPITTILRGPPPAPHTEAMQSQTTSHEIVANENTEDVLLWVAASTTAGLGIAFLVRRLVSLGLLPLLSRIAHTEIYENDARRTIHQLIVTEPGLCLNELVGRTGYSRNAVSYHLFVLEKEEEIVSVKDGKYRRYFLRNGKYVNGAKNVVAALRNETTLKLAQTVAQRPGTIQRDICIELGATPSAACWHAKRLLDLGIIRKERVANTVRYFPGEALVKYDLSDFGLPQGAPVPTPTPA